MEPMQTVFNSRMEAITSNENYPKYARSDTKPVVRARQIIDKGHISDQPCSCCVDLKQHCYRFEESFSKCAYCTSKDKKKEFCHLPGREGSPAPERRKRRKITHNIYAPTGDAGSNADTMTGTLLSGTLASGLTPFASVPVRPSPEPMSAMTGIIHTHAAPPVAASECTSQATLERVTALENQVSGLEAKYIELLVKIDEGKSGVSSSSTPATAGASPTKADVTFEDLQAQQLSDAAPPLAAAARRATREWVEGPIAAEAHDAPLSVEIAVVENADVKDVDEEETFGLKIRRRENAF